MKVVVAEASSGAWTTRSLLLSCLAFRIVNSFALRTYFNPDEFWQNQEVAYEIVFGNGLLTWEWREPARIRGYAHVLPTIVLYWLLKASGLDYPFLIVRDLFAAMRLHYMMHELF